MSGTGRGRVAVLVGISLIAWIALAFAARRLLFPDRLGHGAVEARLNGVWDCRHVWWRVGWFGWDYECRARYSDSDPLCMNVEVDASRVTGKSGYFSCGLPRSAGARSA